MKTDIWMPLYIGDYLADTLHLSTEQHGAYLLLMMAYWRNGGPLPDCDDQLSSISRLMPNAWQSHRDRIAKFFTIKEGLWHHKRIDAELEKSKQMHEKRLNAAILGASKRWSKKDKDAKGNANGIPRAMPNAYESQCDLNAISQSQSHIAYIERPSLNEVVEYALSLACGLPEWKATEWWNEMQGGGWIDHKHRPVNDWRAILRNVKVKWVADGMPSGPPASKAYGTTKTNPRNDHLSITAQQQTSVVQRKLAMQRQKDAEAEQRRAQQQERPAND